MPSQTDLRAWLRHPVDFEVADDAADSRFVFRPPHGEERATANEAVGALSQGIRTMNADPSARAWATPAILALRLMARGALTDPNANERSQLQEAARGVDRDPATAQAKLRAFLAALAADAPEVAVTPQRSSEGDAPPVAPRMEPARPRTFVGTLVVRLDDPAAVDASPEVDRATDADPATVASVSLRVRPQDSGWGMVDASDVWARENHHFGTGARQGIRTLMSASATVWPPSARVLADPDLGTVRLTEDELSSLATGRVTAALAAHRVQVEWPADLEREVTSRAVVRRTDRSSSDRPALFSRESVFRLDWSVAVGDQELTADEVERLVASSSGLLRLRDQWVFVDPQRLQRLRDQSSQDVTADQALRAAASGELDIDGRTTEVDTVGWLDDLRRRLAGQERDKLVEKQPITLDGQLRDYQLEGLRWMAQLVDLELGGCLADDMGLGKTIMFIALHLHRAAQGETRPTLVVCPASVVGNWVREIERFAPDQPVRRHHGSDRTLSDLKSGLVVTTYATMRRDVEDLADIDWGMVVADEAQNVKNVRSAAARALRGLPAGTKLALTGTPVENNLAELWAILDWTTPGLLGSAEQFRADWSRRIERHGDTDRAQQLSALIRPFVLRRRKSDPGIAPELPPKIETDYRVGLTREQVGLYEAVVRDTMAQIERGHIDFKRCIPCLMGR